MNGEMILRRTICTIIGGLLGCAGGIFILYVFHSPDSQLAMRIGSLAGLVGGGLGQGRFLVTVFLGLFGSLVFGIATYILLLGLAQGDIGHFYTAGYFVYFGLVLGALAGIVAGIWVASQIHTRDPSRWLRWL
jgi:hypothetical protein